MKKLIALAIAAAFAGVSMTAVAQAPKAPEAKAAPAPAAKAAEKAAPPAAAKEEKAGKGDKAMRCGPLGQGVHLGAERLGNAIVWKRQG